MAPAHPHPPTNTYSLSVAPGSWGKKVGGTEEACSLGKRASGLQLPVRFQAGGPAYLLTEEPFMGLGFGMGGDAGQGANQVRAA